MSSTKNTHVFTYPYCKGQRLSLVTASESGQKRREQHTCDVTPVGVTWFVQVQNRKHERALQVLKRSEEAEISVFQCCFSLTNTTVTCLLHLDEFSRTAAVHGKVYLPRCAPPMGGKVGGFIACLIIASFFFFAIYTNAFVEYAHMQMFLVWWHSIVLMKMLVIDLP